MEIKKILKLKFTFELLYTQDENEIPILSSKTFHDTLCSHFSNCHILPPISNLNNAETRSKNWLRIVLNYNLRLFNKNHVHLEFTRDKWVTGESLWGVVSL